MNYLYYLYELFTLLRKKAEPQFMEARVPHIFNDMDHLLLWHKY
jgi:hypothetical protein